MTTPSEQLVSLLRDRKAALLAHWRDKIRLLEVAKNLETPVLDDHMSDLLDELILDLGKENHHTLIEAGGPIVLHQNPVVHGLERKSLGFNLVEVVAEYNALRSVIIQQAEDALLLLAGSPIHAINRVIDGAIGVAVRTHAHQQAEEIRLQRNEHLAFVVHDLRSPLASISLASALLMRGDLEDEARGLVEIIQASMGKLDRLTKRILYEDAHLRAQADQTVGRAWTNLYEMVNGLLLELKPLAERSKVQLKLEMDEALTGYVDAGRAELVFQNLLSNAIRYTPGGTVSIRGARTSEGIECVIEDTGAGIAPERLEKIFQAGESDHPSGFGLGLPIVKTLMDAHRGCVKVESELAQGTRFTLIFPKPDCAE